MSSYEPIGALLRGLEVLRALNEDGPQAIKDLHRVTGIAKPTLVRIVETLQHAGYVGPGDADRRYAVTPRVLGLANGYEEQRWLMDVAGPLLDEFRASAGWPVELGVFDADAIVILNTSRQAGYLSVNRKPGSRVSLLKTALGRAYLGALPDESCAALLSRLALLPEEAFEVARSPRQYRQLLDQVRERGYATADRETLTNGRALAVAIVVDGEPIASVNLVAHASAMSMVEFEQKWAQKLVSFGQRVAQACKR
jgi:IclR family mhp operon transcriptional activator